MATISKFYLRDAASPNTGTLPGAGDAFINPNAGAGTPATGARTSRDATDVVGAANPDTESSITAAANQTAQQLEHRRFVSRPLAAHTFDSADGNWTWSYARSESNTLHNGRLTLTVYAWRPGTGARVGTAGQLAAKDGTAMSATAETADSVTFTWSAGNPVTIQDGDILVFEVNTGFTQSMSTAYTDQFAYDGTTEASSTTCASFVTPPAALTLFAAAAHSLVAAGNRDARKGAIPQRILRRPVACYLNALRPEWRSRRSGLLVPVYA